jgi:hypothetical protein
MFHDHISRKVFISEDQPMRFLKIISFLRIFANYLIFFKETKGDRWFGKPNDLNHLTVKKWQ